MMDASICGLGPGGAQPGADGAEILSARKSSRGHASRRTRHCSATMPVSFTLNGKTVVGRADETLLETADEHGIEIPRLCYMEGMRPDGNCRTCMVEIKGERVLAPSCCRYPKQGMEVTTNSARALVSQKMSLELLLSDMPETAYTLDSELDQWAKKLDDRQAALPRAPAAEGRPVAPGDGREPRRLHPVQPLRARLPRGAGQRRHRLRLPRRPLEDRVRLRRSDGRLDVRRLRRVRAGVPDRRADAGARSGQGRARQAGRLGLPVLRRRLPAHLQHQGQHDPLRAGQGRPRELEPPVREGPLRLRLRAAQASAHEAADPQGRASPKHKDFVVDPDNWQRRLPRGDVGRGAGLRRHRPARDPRHLRQAGARRLRLGQGHQRRGVSLPEAGAHRLRLATTSTTARACATPRASRR